MCQMLHRTIVEVVSGDLIRKVSRGIARKRRDCSRPTTRNLLVGEAHPHGRLWIDTGCKWQGVLVGNLARQANLNEHGANRSVRDQAIESEVGRGNQEATKVVAALEPVGYVLRIG